MSGDWYHWQGDTLTLLLRVQPKASRNEIIGPTDDGQGGEYLKIRITAPPVEGKANNQLIAFLAKVFSVAKSRIHIVAGEGGRQKRVQITSPGTVPPFLPPPD